MVRNYIRTTAQPKSFGNRSDNRICLYFGLDGGDFRQRYLEYHQKVPIVNQKFTI